jgi:hypothetical protein
LNQPSPVEQKINQQNKEERRQEKNKLQGEDASRDRVSAKAIWLDVSPST